MAYFAPMKLRLFAFIISIDFDHLQGIVQGAEGVDLPSAKRECVVDGLTPCFGLLCTHFPGCIQITLWWKSEKHIQDLAIMHESECRVAFPQLRRKPLPTRDEALRSNPPVRALVLGSDVFSLINPARVTINHDLGKNDLLLQKITNKSDLPEANLTCELGILKPIYERSPSPG
jgi:hypothetical protein